MRAAVDADGQSGHGEAEAKRGRRGRKYGRRLQMQTLEVQGRQPTGRAGGRAGGPDRHL